MEIYKLICGDVIIRGNTFILSHFTIGVDDLQNGDVCYHNVDVYVYDTKIKITKRFDSEYEKKIGIHFQFYREGYENLDEIKDWKNIKEEYKCSWFGLKKTKYYVLDKQSYKIEKSKMTKDVIILPYDMVETK